MQIFISYRRSDSKAIARLIAETLRTRYGRDSVFQDVTEIPPGADLPNLIRREVGRSDLCLALMGPMWLGENGMPATDYVRLEIEEAFANRLEVLPVLVVDGTMPDVNDLPPSIQLLPRMNALQIDSGSNFKAHMEALYRAIEDGEDMRGRLDEQHRIVDNARRTARALDKEGWQFCAQATGDQYLFLLTLKRILDATKQLFNIQLSLAHDLIRGVEAQGKGLDDSILEAANRIPVERHWLRRRLRNETDKMREVHGAMLRLLSRNRDLHALIPDLQELYEHLSMWVAKYECLRDEEGMCLIFVGVAQKMQFPQQVEASIQEAVKKFETKLGFR